MKSITNYINIPEFEKFIRKPNNNTCKIIDPKSMLIEVLWWYKKNTDEFELSFFSDKLILDWDYSIVLRYKREKDKKYYIVWTLSFSCINKKIIIKQLQWSKDKKVSYRVNACFDNTLFYINVLENSFSKKWYYIELEKHPTWIENMSFNSKADINYFVLWKYVNILNIKYWFKTYF